MERFWDDRMKYKNIFLAVVAFFSISLSAQAQNSMSQKAEEITDSMQEKTSFAQSKYDQVYDLNMDFLRTVEGLGERPSRNDSGFTAWMRDYNNAVQTRHNGLRGVLSASELAELTKGQRNSN